MKPWTIFSSSRYSRPVAEIVQPIKQQLLVTDLEEASEDISHPPGHLPKGKNRIRQHYPPGCCEVTASTAYAARFVAEHRKEFCG